MGWTCQFGHENPDPNYSAETYWCEFAPCTGYVDYEDFHADDGDAEELACDPEEPPSEPKGKDPKAEPCPGPHVAEDGEYPIDISKAKVKKKSSKGNIHLLALPSANTNSTDRPKMPKFLISDRKKLVSYEGAGGSGRVHQVIVDPLDKMLAAMKAEGQRIDDKALQEVTVSSPWRDPGGDGKTFLRVIKGVIKAHKNCHKSGKKCVAFSEGEDKRFKDKGTHCPSGFQKVSFPSDLETEAKSELGTRGSTKYNTFKSNLGKASGWTSSLATYCLKQTGRFKAPAGGSPHHSGLVVDLNWPIYYEYYDKKKKKTIKKVGKHNISSSRNEWSRRSSVGVWINKHAASFGFKSYNEKDEIWHMEYVLWKGTAADPG